MARRSEDEVKIAIPPKPLPAQQSPDTEETRRRHLRLYRAAMEGKWDTAASIYEAHGDDILARISKAGDTALHIAAAAKHVEFVKELVKRLTKEDLALQNKKGNTALCLAATTGSVELAQVMLDINASLATLRGSKDMLPVNMAALLGHKKMVLYLYEKTEKAFKAEKTDKASEDEDCINLVINLINTNLYDVALKILRSRPELATVRCGKQGTALHALARKPLPSSDSASQNQGLLGRCQKRLSGLNVINNKKLEQEAVDLIEYLWDQVIVLSDKKISKLMTRPRLLFAAAEQGNIEFLTILIREYPDVIVKVDENGYTIFHIAVLHRHADIFKLIHGIGSMKALIASYKDSHGNNMLHLAACLAPENRLKIVSGAALQMQRELLWFKEVSGVVQPFNQEDQNRNKQTPRALFTKKHKNLMKRGEKWMRETATQCMFAATIIATVVFAAALTVPGGNIENVGTPIYLQKASFKIFGIADAISLISSSTSILSFLTILTSRYAEEDFLWSLPLKLIVGLTTLFISIAAMMVVFCAIFFIIFQRDMLGVTILVTAVASVPVFLFILQHYRLFLDVLHSTLGSSSLFKPSKHSLFSEKVKSTERKKLRQAKQGN